MEKEYKYYEKLKEPEIQDDIGEKARKKLIYVCLLCSCFMLIEFVGGLYANSVAIMTDAAHLLSDLGGFVISIYAIYYTKSPPDRNFTYGYHRAEIIGAIGSVFLIWILTILLLNESIQRIFAHDQVINGGIMLATSTIGLVFNLIMVYILHSSEVGGCGHNHDNDNLGSIFVHGDHKHDHSHHHSHDECNEHTHEHKHEVKIKSKFTEMKEIKIINNVTTIEEEPREDDLISNNTKIKCGESFKTKNLINNNISTSKCNHDHEGHVHEHNHTDNELKCKSSVDLSFNKSPKKYFTNSCQISPLILSNKSKETNILENLKPSSNSEINLDSPDKLLKISRSNFHTRSTKNQNQKNINYLKNQGISDFSSTGTAWNPVHTHQLRRLSTHNLKRRYSRILHNLEHYIVKDSLLEHDHDNETDQKLEEIKFYKKFGKQEKQIHFGHSHLLGQKCNYVPEEKITSFKKDKEVEKNEKDNINVRAAMIHIIGDIIQSIGVIIAAVIIYFFPKFQIIDPLMTIIFSIIVMFTTFPIIKQCLIVIMQGAPEDLDVDDVKKTILEVHGVEKIVCIHAYSLSVEKNILNCKIISNLANDNIVSDIHKNLEDFEFYHINIEVQNLNGEYSVANCNMDIV